MSKVPSKSTTWTFFFVQAHRVKDACGQVFRFGIAIGRCKRNPATDLKAALQPVQANHLAAIVEPARVEKLLRVMHDYQGNLLTRCALGLSALLLLLPGELRHLEWDWVDMLARTLTVPASVMKRTKAEKANGPPHLVPWPTRRMPSSWICRL